MKYQITLKKKTMTTKFDIAAGILQSRNLILYRDKFRVVSKDMTYTKLKELKEELYKNGVFHRIYEVKEKAPAFHRSIVIEVNKVEQMMDLRSYAQQHELKIVEQ